MLPSERSAVVQRKIPAAFVLLSLASIGAGGEAAAQPAATQTLPGIANSVPRTFDVKRMSFETWCQEIQRYAADRCDARRQEDVLAFENYRSVIERYEIDFLRQREQNRQAQERVERDPTLTDEALTGLPAR
jgi:hypothetical protein